MNEAARPLADQGGAAAGATQAFDAVAADYERQVALGVRLSGETREHFAQRRVEWLVRLLGDSEGPGRVRRILDLGCGTGGTASRLLQAFHAEEVRGVDVSSGMLEVARRAVKLPGVVFQELSAALASGWICDLIYAANVLHHVPALERPGLLAGLRELLRPGGHFAVFENNPWNPGARAVMARVPFDDDAQPLSPPACAHLLEESGLRPIRRGSLFYFPRWLARLRPLEPLLEGLPLGAQHFVVAVR